MTTYLRPRLIHYAALVAGITAIAMSGCNGDDNTTGGASQKGSMVMLIHDAPVDNFTEVWVTVESVSMIGADSDSASGEVVLASPVRMDLLSLDSAALVLAMAEIEAGAYSKIRLQVSDPEFVRNDDSVFTDEDIQLVANGHVDLNTQGDVFIKADDLTVVSLDVDLDNSVQINQTGNGRYILRPQIFVDNESSGEEGVIIDNATITSIDAATGTLTIETGDNGGGMHLTVRTTVQTEIMAVNGLPLVLATLAVGSTVDIVGTMNIETGVITATHVKLVL
jgi:hypothetical protein